MGERVVPVRYEAKISGYLASVERMRSATSRMAAENEAKVKKAGANWEQMGTRAQVAGLALGAGVAFATKRFADFDQAMSAASAALPGAGAQMEDLRKLAIKLGADTQFSATEAAQGITEMAKAGASAKDIMGGGLKGALDLAAAGQLSVADAAGIAATATKQYNLAGSQVTHVADLYAAAAGKALGSVQDIALAQKYAGITANSMGISIEETTGVLALFASKGLIGEQAGTTFRSMLLSLTSPSKIAKTAMDELGISMYDARGKFVGVQGAAAELQKRLGPLDEATRNQALGQIFGNESMNGAIALYEGGAQAVQQWTKDVNDAGFAARQAAKLTDNWKGDLERLGGSLDAVFVKNGSAANGALRATTQNLERMVDAFGSAPEPLQLAAFGLTAVTSAALLTGGTFLTLVPKITAGKLAMIEMGIVSEATAGKMLTAAKNAGIVGAVIGGVTVGGNAMQVMWDSVAGANEDATRSLDNYLTKGKDAPHVSDLMVHGFEDLDQSLKFVTDGGAGRKVGEFFEEVGSGAGLFGGTRADDAATFFKQLDEGLAGLTQGGQAQRAAEQFKLVAEAGQRQGLTLDQVKKVLPQYASTLASAGTSSEDAAKKLSGLNGMVYETADALAKAEGSSTVAGAAILTLGANAGSSKDAIEEMGKTIQSAMDSASSAFLSSVDVLSKYDPAGAADRLTAAQEKVAAAEQAAQDTRERISAKKKKTVSDEQALERARSAVDKARAEETKARAQQGAAGLEAMYRSSLDQAAQFTTNIDRVTRKGLDPQVVAKLLAEGPEKAAPALEALLGNNSKNLIAMTNKSEAEIRRINSSVVAQARLTAMAVNAPTDALAEDLDVAMGIAQIKGRKGAKLTAEGMARELGIGLTELQNVAREFGIEIPNPKPISISADGSAARAEAIRTQGALQIAPPPPVMIRADTTPALLKVGQLQAVVDQMTGKTIHIYAIEHIQQVRESGDVARANAMQTANAYATGSTYRDPTGKKPILRAGGGLVDGPGTATSDSVLMRASKGEYVARASAVDFYGKQFFDAVNARTYVPAAGPMVGGGMGNHTETNTRTVNHYGPIIANSTDQYEEEKRLQNLTAI